MKKTFSDFVLFIRLKWEEKKNNIFFAYCDISPKPEGQELAYTAWKGNHLTPYEIASQ